MHCENVISRVWRNSEAVKASCVSEGPVFLAGTHIQQLAATCSSSSGELSPKSDLQGPLHTCAHTKTHRQLEIKEILESPVPNNKTQGMFDLGLPGNVSRYINI